MIFECVEDDVAPDEIKQAGADGRLQVGSAIGWIDLDKEDFDYCRNGCVYRSKS